VYALTGGFAPLMPAVDLSLLKKKPPSDKKVFFPLLAVGVVISVAVWYLYCV